MSDMAIFLLIPKARTRLHGKLKGLSHKRGWVKSAENLDTSPFKRGLSIDTTFSHMYIARQSLKDNFNFVSLPLLKFEPDWQGKLPVVKGNGIP
jgi:hypothetical protein